jgi:hypothetical protein
VSFFFPGTMNWIDTFLYSRRCRSTWLRGLFDKQSRFLPIGLQVKELCPRSRRVKESIAEARSLQGPAIEGSFRIEDVRGERTCLSNEKNLYSTRPDHLNVFELLILIIFGIRGSAVGWGTALYAGRSRVRFPMESLEFFSDLILPVALWPWGRLNV